MKQGPCARDPRHGAGQGVDIQHQGTGQVNQPVYLLSQPRLCCVTNTHQRSVAQTVSVCGFHISGGPAELTAGLALRKGPDTAGCGGGLPLSVLSPPQMHLPPPGPSKPPGHSPELPITTPALAIRSFGHWEKSITLPDLDPNLNPKVSQPT